MSKIELDPDSTESVRDQLVDQLRYLIARGHYTVDDPLPSTRTLADQLDISFHTVRKAYKTLEEDGILSSKVGSGYRVQERTPLSKHERMERGAKVVHDTLQTLIGLGLNDAEIESLFQEQANLLDHANLHRKLIAVGPYSELNEMCADQLTSALQQPVRPIPLSALDQHTDADYAFAPYPHLTRVLETLPRGDTFGFITHLPSRPLERVARLLDRESIGLVTQDRDTIGPLSDQIRSTTEYGGQVIAASIEDGVEHLSNVVQQTDVLLYTPNSRRQLLPFLDDPSPDYEELSMIVSKDSLDTIVEAVPA